MTALEVAALDALTERLRRRPGDAREERGADATDAPWGDRQDVRGRGAYFTPPELARFVVDETLRPWAAPAEPTEGPPVSPPRRAYELRVLDPACGDGRFLRLVAEWAARHLPAAQLALLGIERDPRTASAARAHLASLPAELASRCRVDIREGEALLGAEPAEPVDAVVGNPPYIRSIHLRARDPELWAALRQRFAATSHGEWDLYAPFIERSLTWLRPGGRAGLVVPSRWLTAAFATKLREVVAPSVAALVDFGALQLFEGATTYASVVILERERVAAPAELARLGASGWVRDEVALANRGGAPWILRTGPARRQLADAAGATGTDGAAGTLGDVAQIAKGCGTNADRVFVVRGRIEGDLFEGVNGDGAAVRLEAALLRRCLRGRDVPAEPNAAGGPVLAPAVADFCLLPYRGLPPETSDGPPALLTWDELSRAAPGVAAYFASQRGALEQRERGRFAGPAFYQLGRPQNLRFLLDEAPKIVIPDVAARGRAAIDRGSLVLDSAYAVRPHPHAPAPWHRPELLLALLRSPLVRLWLDMVGVPLRGGYFRMKTAFLSPMPLPPAASAELLDAAADASAAGERAAADELLRQAYGIEEAAWRAARGS